MNLPKQSKKFSFKNINDSIQYILIQTFQANSATSQISQRFHDSISNLLNKPYLIFDLRNNEGGAEKEMNKYLKLLKNYTKRSIGPACKQWHTQPSRNFYIRIKAIK